MVTKHGRDAGFPSPVRVPTAPLVMPVRRTVLAVLLAAAASAAAEPLRVASYNLENYNLTDRMTADGFAKNAPKPEKAKTALRTVIRAMNADVLAVQEIGGAPFVEELRRDLASDGLNYPYTVTLDGPDPHRRLAVFSKKPFIKTNLFARIETGFAIPSPEEHVAVVNRGLLGVDIAAGKTTLRIYTVHLKSRLTRDKRDPRAEGERLAEALAIIRTLGDKPAHETLLLGDFNDAPNTATLTAFTKPPIGYTRLDTVDSRGENWTYRNDKKGFFDRSDYAFTSATLRPRVTRSRAYEHPKTAEASDHRPVVIDFDFPADAPAAK